MKKILTILLVSLMVLTLTGCNSKKEEETVKVEEPVVQEVTKEETKQEEVVTTEPVVEETPVVEEVKEEKVDVTELSYWVNFLNYDGSVISRKAYKYGSTPVAPLNPTYEDGVIYYNFLEWDKKLTPVYGTQTYKALYEKTGYVHNDHDDRNDEPSTPTLTPWDGVLSPVTLNTMNASLKFDTSTYPTLASTTNLFNLFTPGTIMGSTGKFTEDILVLTIPGYGSFKCFLFAGTDIAIRISLEYQDMPGDPVGLVFKGDVIDFANIPGAKPTTDTVLGDLRFLLGGS